MDHWHYSPVSPGCLHMIPQPRHPLCHLPQGGLPMGITTYHGLFVWSHEPHRCAGLADLNTCVSSVLVAGFRAGASLGAAGQGATSRSGILAHLFTVYCNWYLVVDDHQGGLLLLDLLCKISVFTKAFSECELARLPCWTFRTSLFLIWHRNGL